MADPARPVEPDLDLGRATPGIEKVERLLRRRPRRSGGEEPPRRGLGNRALERLELDATVLHDVERARDEGAPRRTNGRSEGTPERQRVRDVEDDDVTGRDEHPLERGRRRRPGRRRERDVGDRGSRARVVEREHDVVASPPCSPPRGTGSPSSARRRARRPVPGRRGRARRPRRPLPSTTPVPPPRSRWAVCEQPDDRLVARRNRDRPPSTAHPPRRTIVTVARDRGRVAVRDRDRRRLVRRPDRQRDPRRTTPSSAPPAGRPPPRRATARPDASPPGG